MQSLPPSLPTLPSLVEKAKKHLQNPHLTQRLGIGTSSTFGNQYKGQAKKRTTNKSPEARDLLIKKAKFISRLGETKHSQQRDNTLKTGELPKSPSLQRVGKVPSSLPLSSHNTGIQAYPFQPGICRLFSEE